MNIYEQRLTGSEFAERIGISVDNLYDWRRRGIDLGLGGAINGRKRYSTYDLIEASIFGYLRHAHYDNMRVAMSRARRITPSLLNKLGVSIQGHPYKSDVGRRYAFFDMQGGALMSDDPAAFVAMGSKVVEVIDLDAMAEQLGAGIKATIEKG